MISAPPFRQYSYAETIVKAVPVNNWSKWLMDIIIAIFVTVFILSWMIPIVGLIIQLTSAGPAIYRQLRTGRNGRQFYCLKFRTMYVSAQSEFRQATQNDPRITPIGNFLRRTNLDEMPQFINVLLGDMSIVGPRPHAVQHDEQYWALPGYRERYLIRPGITGMAQVRGLRGETSQLMSMKHRVRFDHWYIQNQSLGLDLKICFWTVLRMFEGNINAW